MARKCSATEEKTNSSSTTKKENAVNCFHNDKSENLSRTGTIGYKVGMDTDSNIHWRIHSNSGKGFFSTKWISFDDIRNAMEAWPEEQPIVSMTLFPLFSGQSVNTANFLLTSLAHEGVLELLPGKNRHYQLGDVDAFLAGMKKMRLQHRQSLKT